jgi:hypothetical protein
MFLTWALGYSLFEHPCISILHCTCIIVLILMPFLLVFMRLHNLPMLYYLHCYNLPRDGGSTLLSHAFILICPFIRCFKQYFRNPNSIHMLRSSPHLWQVPNQYMQLHPLLTQTISRTLPLEFQLVYLYFKVTLCQAVHHYPARLFIIITWLLETLAFHLNMVIQ